MRNRWKTLVVSVMTVILAIGVFVVCEVWPCGNCAAPSSSAVKNNAPTLSGNKSTEATQSYKCPMGCETSDKPGKCSKCGTNLEKEDPNSPDNLLKTADKLCKEADKTKNVVPLMKHTELMLNKSAEIMARCNQVPEGHGWFDGQSVETVTKLMEKCVEMTTKCQSLVPEDQKKTVKEKACYTCPMHPEVMMDKPGNCPKCGTTMEKK